jgi:hypothetical protein
MSGDAVANLALFLRHHDAADLPVELATALEWMKLHMCNFS